jgi:hypothetical protein
MLFFILMYVATGILFLLLYAWHEHSVNGELARIMAEKTVDEAKEEAS